jgi:alkylation response protein AidB-like acyl-CoA dehydrogenase
MAVNHFMRDMRDSRFVLYEYLGIDRLLGYEAYAGFSPESIEQLMQKAWALAHDELAPSLQDGDRTGCVRSDEGVKVPASFHSGWRALSKGGWLGLGSSPEFGGMGAPQVVKGLIEELFVGANLSLHLTGGLTTGNARLIETFADDDLRRLFVSKLYGGRWSGTMCLTEAEAGSDVGWLTTRAAPLADSDDPRIYAIQGKKRFITGGDHDLAENIIHLVLARIEGDPAGSRGVSLFIVPKIWVNPDGGLAGSNDVQCIGLEEKMGVHGSPTCALRFGQNGSCRGFLLGRARSGLMQMFQLMNEARLYTGLMGMSLAASAYDAARAYAARRVQGPPFYDKGAGRLPIIRHPDVRRMLMNLKAGTEAMRALIAHTYYMLDRSRHEPDDTSRQRAQRQVDLLTPVVKAYCTDFSYSLIRDAIQVMGGNGYCQGYPAEQLARDCKVLSVWEGTNYIQAQDLVRRKLPQDDGLAVKETLHEVNNFIKKFQRHPDLKKDFAILKRVHRLVSEYPARFRAYAQGELKELVPLNATRFLENLAEMFMGRIMLEQAIIAAERLHHAQAPPQDTAFYRGKVASARYFCRNIMPKAFARYVALQEEDDSALAGGDEAFGL